MIVGAATKLGPTRCPPALAFVVAAALLAGQGPGRAATEPDPTAHLHAERDALIQKIASGQDYEASVKRWKELVTEHDRLVASSTRATELQLENRENHLKELQSRAKLRDEYHATADYDVSWRCTFSPDPAHPIPSTEDRFKPDWGKVVRRQQLRRLPKNALDEGEPVTMFEVKGIARSYQFAGDHFGYGRHSESFDAAVGDLVLVCVGSEDTSRDAPPGWGPTLVKSGFAVRITEPPLIVKKARWAPVHVTGSFFFWAIHDVVWKPAPEAFILSNIEIARDLGERRYKPGQRAGEQPGQRGLPLLQRHCVADPGHGQRDHARSGHNPARARRKQRRETGRRPSLVRPGYVERALSFEVSHHQRYRHLRRDRQHHVHVLPHDVPFLYTT